MSGINISVNFLLAGINTFTFGSAPSFGSGGGTVVAAHSDWINGIVGTSEI